MLRAGNGGTVPGSSEAKRQSPRDAAIITYNYCIFCISILFYFYVTPCDFLYILLESGRVMGLRFEISFGGTVIVCKLLNLLGASLAESLYLKVCHSLDVVWIYIVYASDSGLLSSRRYWTRIDYGRATVMTNITSQQETTSSNKEGAWGQGLSLGMTCSRNVSKPFESTGCITVWTWGGCR